MLGPYRCHCGRIYQLLGDMFVCKDRHAVEFWEREQHNWWPGSLYTQEQIAKGLAEAKHTLQSHIESTERTA